MKGQIHNIVIKSKIENFTKVQYVLLKLIECVSINIDCMVYLLIILLQVYISACLINLLPVYQYYNNASIYHHFIRFFALL